MSYSLAFSQAIVALVYVADKIEQGMFEFIATKQISDDLNIPAPTASKMLRSLNRAGLLESREGAKGGVRLAVPPAQVTMLDVFEAVEYGKPLFRADFELRVTGAKPDRVQQAVTDLFAAAEAAMKTRLEAVTVADLVRKLYP